MPTSTLAKIGQLERLYRIPDVEKVRAYLTAHPDAVDILIEAYPHLERHFGRRVIVELRFPRGCECDYQGDLLAMLQSQSDADTALEQFDRFWDEWWGDASARRESWLVYFAVEYSGELVQ